MYKVRNGYEHAITHFIRRRLRNNNNIVTHFIQNIPQHKYLSITVSHQCRSSEYTDHKIHISGDSDNYADPTDSIAPSTT